MTNNEHKQETDNKEREFKYYPKDFGKLAGKVEHMNLLFHVEADHTTVENDFTLVLNNDVDALVFDAKNLEVLEVALYNSVRSKEDHDKDVEKTSCQHTYEKEKDKLHVALGKTCKKGERITLYFKTITRPTNNTLEGLYFDETPKGAPQQQITQCQQWGFQRLTPCFDDMTAKCTYTTTIIADSTYTNMISNGNAAPGYKEDNGSPRKKDLGNGKSQIVYFNHTTPMAPYLFFLGVGTYATYKREFEYPNGKTFMLELLVPPTAEKKPAEHALEMIAHGIMWIHLNTGEGKYEAQEKKKEMWTLINARDAKKAKGEDCSAEREKLKALCSGLTLGYEYTGDVYREIGMQNSNFGGMENVGNTTITTNRIMPFKQMGDGSFEYMLQVKAHEFYHNLNGSEVTGRDPFSLWLNEAVTVHIETEYISSLVGEAHARIDRIRRLYAPAFGTFAEDSSARAMPIEPVGFNTPDELITGMTYVKAPELVGMIQTLMGKEAFVKGLAAYHAKFKHGNATTQDWLAAMEQASKKDFKNMAKSWLTRTGFPDINVTTTYHKDKKEYVVDIEQKGYDSKGPWLFPFPLCLVDAQGNDIGATSIHWIKDAKQRIALACDEEPAYISLNRNHVAYSRVHWKNQTENQRILQAQTDSDLVNRYMAFSNILDKEKCRLVQNPDAEVSSAVVTVWGKMLQENIPHAIKAQFLSVGESVRDTGLQHKYNEIYAAQQKIRHALADAYGAELEKLYNDLSSEQFAGNYVEASLAGIGNRSLKNLALWILSVYNSEKEWMRIKKQYENAIAASDKYAAVGLYLNSNAPDRKELLLSFKKEAEQHNVSWEAFLSIVGSNNKSDGISIMQEMEKDPRFRIEQSNDQRALYFSFARNRKKSLLTDEGRAFLQQAMIKVSKLNEYTGFHFLSIFGDTMKLTSDVREKLIVLLENVKAALSKEKEPSVYNNIERMLKEYKK